MAVKLGLPSKGRLQAGTVDWFHSRGLKIGGAGGERGYSGEAEGIEGIEVFFLSAGEIPRDLASGRIHVGVTGIDVVRENLPDWPSKVGEVARLGFGFADLVVAVPAAWIDVDSLDDLDAVAAHFRRVHGRRLRIATKYHRLVREYLSEVGVADYQLVDSRGATEGTVANGAAEAIADISSTGRTLEVNGLKRLDDGLVLRSEAALFLSRAADLEPHDRKTLSDIEGKFRLRFDIWETGTNNTD
ncbi:MAG: ATP phosphoribosyltransferase [Albidovulum sp.]|nr:ATP phosphoribosyltransferase [Albidovulum sp.]